MFKSLGIKSVRIGRLKFAPYNPRVTLTPDDPAYQKLKRSMVEFGMAVLLVWNRATGHVVGGNQRLAILLEMGVTHVQVIVVDLSLVREKQLNVALNAIGGRWDERKLADLIADLAKLPEVDVTLTGIDLPDIDAMIAQSQAAALADQPESFDVAAAVDAARSRPAVTKLGDVIRLGRHVVVCGDSSSAQAIALAVEGAAVDLLIADPPYNVAYNASARVGGRAAKPAGRRARRPTKPGTNGHGSPELANDDLDQPAYERWLERVLRNAIAVLGPGASLYIWNGHRQFGPMYTMLLAMGVHVSCVITWAKDRFAIGRGDYKHQTEFCMYGWRADNGAHRWHGGQDQSTLWQVPRDPVKDYVHPTQKPLELAERPMRNSSRPGQTVLDPFLGGGTTLIAAERTGRRCVGVELDPHFCDVIVRRYLAFNGGAGVDADVVARYAAPPAGDGTGVAA